ncbi:hypothetical protein FUT28_07905 [Enterococcus durans]|uniref:hypothetical protein n=1 Tax=Enterococcus durans TaxID=53345 RepID=UPI0011BD7EC2|nr:hypothetical protein [Enterococcus durans]QED60021.1 hypothetical protein FS851_09190 [Enterococcus durans]QED62397.1 hypothetical protein FUT28_07905 [Enterococcus durans]
MGRVRKLIDKFEKFIKNKVSKKPKEVPQKKQAPQPQHYGAMLEEMVKLLPQKEHQRPLVFFQEYSQVRDQVSQKEEEHIIYDEIDPESIYDPVTKEPIYDRVSDEGIYVTITQENFKSEERKKETPKKPPRRKLLQQQHTYENTSPKKEPIYDQVPGSGKPVIPPKPKLTKEFLEEMKQKSHRQNQQKQSQGPLHKPEKER